jgi:molybdenum cofactor guanylyltransferase
VPETSRRRSTLPVAATAIVLAGGRSSRFGSNKLAADVDGSPLLHHAIRAVSDVCAEVLVVGAPSGLSVELPGDLAVVVALDVDAYQGPLVALVDAASAAHHPALLIVAGDMPHLERAVVERLLAGRRGRRWAPGRQGACLLAGGTPQPFPMAIDRAALLAHGRELVEAGERRLRALLDHLDLERIPEVEWRTLDPDGRTLRDIDRPEDLDA